uniref:Type II secretion system protein K n=1 Tax=Hydrogenovibrio crunogenus (strain DSM 25203 / XCL-2) TaxID=317025 RepID=Q31J20_HYDCU
MSDNKQQSGFALITVLLVVTIVAMIASQLVYQQALDIKRTESRLNQAQSLAVANGMETWVKKGLKLDASLNRTDHLQEKWAEPMPPIPFAGGDVSGRLIDLQGRFNLNNLADQDKERFKIWQQIAQRLLRHLMLDPQLESVVSDWVDSDNTARLDGAESDFYLLKNPAYRAGNQMLIQLKELALLKGFTPSIRQVLEPHVAALPAVTTININTAPKSVLNALADWMTDQVAQAWIEHRKTKSATSVTEFRNFLAQQTGLETKKIAAVIKDDVVTVATHYFLLEGRFDYGVVQQQVDTLLYRENENNVVLIQRWFGMTNNG